MNTKEETREKVLKKVQKYKDLSVNYPDLVPSNEDIIIELMDEHAKAIAVEFHKWLFKSTYIKINDDTYVNLVESKEWEQISLDSVFDKFIEETQTT